MNVWSVARASISSLVLSAMLATACGSDSEVPEASCSTCGNTVYTAAQCEEWGAAANCKSSSIGTGMCPSCNFKDCDEPPECGTGTASPQDAGSQMDAALDPECAQAPDGLFPTMPPCDSDDVGTISINGQTNYVCNCTGSCPCGFECGSIDLDTGGTVGGVCAPP